MLGAGHLGLSTAGGGANSKALTFVTAFLTSYTSNGNRAVPVLGQTGDLIFLFVDSNAVASGMTGWNTIYSDTFTVGGNPTYKRAYWKIKTAGDTTFSDTFPNFLQVVYRPVGGTVSTVSSITGLLRASYSTTTPVTQTLTMPTSGINVGVALFATGQSSWATKTSTITPTRHYEPFAGYTSVMLFENLSGTTPIANSTIGGTGNATPILYRAVFGATITLI
jgi:hypothetical protein